MLFEVSLPNCGAYSFGAQRRSIQLRRPLNSSVFSISDDARIASRAPLPQRCGAIDRDLEQGSAPAVAAQLPWMHSNANWLPSCGALRTSRHVNQERLHFCGRTPRIEVSRPRGVSTGFIARPENV
jgi:hypothetical protein